MPKLKNMTGETGTVEIPVPDDEPLVVVYRRSALTPKLQARAVEAQRLMAAERTDEIGPEHVTLICDMLERAIVSWNMTDDQGVTLPTDAGSLADLSFETLNMIATAIQKEREPDPLSASGSSNGSSPTGVSGPHLITTAS